MWEYWSLQDSYEDTQTFAVETSIFAKMCQTCVRERLKAMSKKSDIALKPVKTGCQLKLRKDPFRTVVPIPILPRPPRLRTLLQDPIDQSPFVALLQSLSPWILIKSLRISASLMFLTSANRKPASLYWTRKFIMKLTNRRFWSQTA